MTDLEALRYLLKRLKKEKKQTLKFRIINPNIDIEDLNFNVRTHNCLKRCGVQTIKDYYEPIVDSSYNRLSNLGSPNRIRKEFPIKTLLSQLEFVFDTDEEKIKYLDDCIRLSK